MKKLCLCCEGEGVIYKDSSSQDAYDYSACPVCGGEGIVETCPKSPDGYHHSIIANTGGWHFGETGPWDDIQVFLVCRYCGQELDSNDKKLE